MTEQEFNEFINIYNFFKAGEIIIENGRIKFTTSHKVDGQGFVYLWIEKSSDPGGTYKIIYVGKASKTLKSRFAQHRAGFNGGSVTGIKNANLIRTGINQGLSYLVFARKSPVQDVLGELVSTECIEEMAFIEKLKGQLWNRI